MNLNFEFSDDVWWRPTFANYTNQQLLKLINQHIQDMAVFKANKANLDFIYGFQDLYSLVYLQECLIGENKIRPGQLDYIETVLKEQDLDEEEEEDDEFSIEQIEKKKIRNMHTAILSLYPDLIIPNSSMDEFTPDLAKSIHSKIGAGIMENLGKYRGFEVKPNREEFNYASSSEIDGEMSELFKITRAEMKQIDVKDLNVEKISRVIKLAAQFLNKFLSIRPFANGNGRTARLLTSWLLSKISIVPVSLTEGSQMYNYIGCLREIHSKESIDQPPVALATLILERVFYSFEYYKRALNVLN